MLDIKYIRENQKEIKKAAKNKNIDLDLNKLLELDEKRRDLFSRVDELRSERNKLAKSGKTGKPSAEIISKGKKLKVSIAEVEEKLVSIEADYNKLMVLVPIIPSADTPVGKSEDENVEIFNSGPVTKFDFEPKDHIMLGKDLDIIDFDRGVKVAGYRGYYLKNEGANLQMAIMIYAFNKLVTKGFTPVIPPTLVREFVLFGSGYFAGETYNAEVDEIYKIANEEIEADGKKNKEDKFLIGTAEPSLLAYHANETLKEGDLPLRFCGFSQCYRSEIGSYGKDTKGMYRVHEFMKVEQVTICPADIELSDKLHGEMVAISEELHKELGLPYRKLQICTGDMSAGKYKMFDLEAWIPSRQGYGETGSASNFLDWQARRLNVKYKTKDNKTKVAYMLNNTALATPRTIIAILENHQQSDGSVNIPKVLQPFMPNNISVIEKK